MKPKRSRAVHKAEKILRKMGKKVSRLFDKMMEADADSDAFFALDEIEATLYRHGFIDRKGKRNAGR
jgi:hypothetical protein